jgi:phosphopantothenoylcysteine decarboxylase/phosphopantothenate--cysteine ligase
MGFAIAQAASLRGAAVTLVTGPTHLTPPFGVNTVSVISAEDMAREMLARAAESDIIVKTAAVADYRPKQHETHKIKKDNAPLTLALERTTDILREMGRIKSGQVLVGFAAETRDLEVNAAEKLKRKNLDMIIGNLIGTPDSGFGSDTNQVTIFYRDGSQEAISLMEKDALAHLILDRIREKILITADTN